MQRSCARLLQKMLPFCTRFAWYGVLALSCRSLNYLHNEEARTGADLLFKSSKTFPNVRLGLKRLMRGKKLTVPESKASTMLLMGLAV